MTTYGTRVQAHLPRMKRDAPSTWETYHRGGERGVEGAIRPEGGGDPYFSGSGHQFFIRNGASELMLNLAPRALWRVAEQLLGKGTVVWPAGLDESGYTTGPCFMCDDAVGGLNTHLGDAMGYPPKGSFTTEPALRLPKTGPVWLNGQGTRGLYCTLPNSPSHAPALQRCPLRRSVLRHVAAANVGIHFRCAAKLRRIYRVARQSLAHLAGTVESFQSWRESIRTNIWRYGGRAATPILSSGKSRRIRNRLIAMGPRALSSYGIPKSYTSPDRTRLTTLSVKRQSTDSRKRPNRSPTRSRRTTRMAIFGETGPMKCVHDVNVSQERIPVEWLTRPQVFP